MFSHTKSHATHNGYSYSYGTQHTPSTPWNVPNGQNKTQNQIHESASSAYHHHTAGGARMHGDVPSTGLRNSGIDGRDLASIKQQLQALLAEQ